MNPSDELRHRATAYANAHGIQLEDMLGSGKDGIVFSTNVRSAVKVFSQQETFRREWTCYQRFQENGIREVLGHHVPQSIGADEDLLIVEMSIVQPPFLLDFASAYLDVPPDFSEEVIEQWQHSKREEFGENWSGVMVILEVLKQDFGVYLLDVHPGNIAF